MDGMNSMGKGLGCGGLSADFADGHRFVEERNLGACPLIGRKPSRKIFRLPALVGGDEVDSQ